VSAYRPPAKTREDLYRHSRRRARERYGIILTSPMWKQLSLDIQRGKAAPLGKQSHSRSWFEMDVHGKRCVVVYNNLLNRIATFLPLEALAGVEPSAPLE
jgi:hypothetical protein